MSGKVVEYLGSLVGAGPLLVLPKVDVPRRLSHRRCGKLPGLVIAVFFLHLHHCGLQTSEADEAVQQCTGRYQLKQQHFEHLAIYTSIPVSPRKLCSLF